MTTVKLSDTALIVLANAANRDDRLVPRRPKSPAIVDINACRALVKAKLLESVALPHIARPDLVTTGKQDDGFMGFRITNAGLRSINHESPVAPSETGPTGAPTAPPGATVDAVAQEAVDAPDAAQDAPTVADAPARADLRDAATAVLAAWDADEHIGDTHPLAGAVEALRAALAAPGGSGAPREGTKAAQVLALLSRPEGATNEQVQAAMGWNNNTVRGFFAGLRKKGMKIDAVKANEPKGGSMPTVYRMAEAA